MVGQSIGNMSRRILLVIHNCWLNGMANIFLHNSLDIFTKDSHSDDEGKIKNEKYQKESVSVKLNDCKTNSFVEAQSLNSRKEDYDDIERDSIKVSLNQEMLTNSPAYYKRDFSNKSANCKNVDSR